MRLSSGSLSIGDRAGLSQYSRSFPHQNRSPRCDQHGEPADTSPRCLGPMRERVLPALLDAKERVPGRRRQADRGSRLCAGQVSSRAVSFRYKGTTCRLLQRTCRWFGQAGGGGQTRARDRRSDRRAGRHPRKNLLMRSTSSTGAGNHPRPGWTPSRRMDRGRTCVFAHRHGCLQTAWLFAARAEENNRVTECPRRTPDKIVGGSGGQHATVDRFVADPAGTANATVMDDEGSSVLGAGERPADSRSRAGDVPRFLARAGRS